MNSFNTNKPGATRDKYDILPPVAGTVVASDKVKPNEVIPYWRKGDWAHRIVIKTYTGEQITLGNSAEDAIDIKVGDVIVIGEVFDNSKCNGLNFYSNKHTMYIHDHGFHTYNKLS